MLRTGAALSRMPNEAKLGGALPNGLSVFEQGGGVYNAGSDFNLPALGLQVGVIDALMT